MSTKITACNLRCNDRYMYMRYVLNYYVLNIIFLDDKLCDSLFTVIKIDNDDDIPHETNIGKQQEIHINKVIIVF